ncbi:MAG: hypothetical protein K2O34_08025, partial [Acetatifactor sp.]|nr:hypothetical protein [Acetatifactor sp.]
ERAVKLAEEKAVKLIEEKLTELTARQSEQARLQIDIVQFILRQTLQGHTSEEIKAAMMERFLLTPEQTEEEYHRAVTD